MNVRNVFWGTILATLMAACGSTTSEPRQTAEAKGGVHYGGVFRMNEVGDVRSLYPLNITEVAGFRIASQVYEGLVKYNQKTLEPIPALAERWEANEDATEWTFYLKKGVRFHEDPCFSSEGDRDFKADDVEWCLRQLCTAGPENQMFWLIKDRIVGANAFYEATTNGDAPDQIEGFEIIDDYTVKFKLAFSSSEFPRILGHNAFYIYPEEALDHYGKDLASHAVGTGSFEVKLFKANELAVLERNPDYHQSDKNGNQLPYLDAIQVTFIKDKKSELLKFKQGDLDMLFTLPVELYSEVLGELTDADEGSNINFKPEVMPCLSVNYYGFLHDSELFSNVNLRKAFNLAIDRKSLINYSLQGEGAPGIYGIIPPAFDGYKPRNVQGFVFDPIKARAYLDSAGYPNAYGFPELTLELTSEGANYERVAQVVQKMLKDNLNVDINLSVVPKSQQLDNAEMGKSLFWRDNWVADYPDPENFLCLFVNQGANDVHGGRTYLNSVRYNNPTYDSLYLAALKETDRDKRYDLYQQLDQILIDDAVVMPIYYEEFTRLIPVYVKNFPQNSIEYRDLTSVWLDPKYLPAQAS